MAGANTDGRGGGRLKSWKQIAAYFAADERTVRRWEGRGLPVRRIPGGARATVYANVAELEIWMQGRAASDVVPTDGARTVRRRFFLMAAVALSLAGGGFAGLIAQGAFAGQRDAPVPRQPSERAVELYLAGTFNWEKRTPASLQQARDQFGAAIARDPSYAPAYAGLANTYLLLREYAGMPDSEAYPRARDAAERALALDPRLADAHAALAFVTFFWTRDWERGLGGFRRAIELDPASAGAWHWYGTALLHAGQVDQAVKALGEAQRREPTSRSIVADRALVLYHAGRVREAVTVLRQLTGSEPEFLSPHAYLAYIYLAEHDYQGSLREAEATARLKGDAEQLDAARRAATRYRHAGPLGMIGAMLAEQERLHRAGRGSAYETGAVHALLGEKGPALRLLEASNQAGESAFVSVRVDTRLRALHGDPRFTALAAAVARPPSRRN